MLKMSMKKNKSRRDWLYYVVIVGLLTLGGIFLPIVFREIKEDTRLINVCTEKTVGTVVRFIEGNNFQYEEDESEQKVKGLFYPVFQYVADSRMYEQISMLGNKEGKERFKTGQKVTVMYNPEFPNEYYVTEDRKAMKGNSHTGFFIILFVFALGGFGIYKSI